MTFQFKSLEDCRIANSELSNHFSGNGRHYNYNPHNWTIEILDECPDMDLARSICVQCGGRS